MLPLFDNLKLLCYYTRTIHKDRGFRKAKTFFLRSLLHFNSVIKWLRVAENFYTSFGQQNEMARLANLPLHSYASYSLNYKERSNLLCHHYQTLIKIFTPQKLQKFLSYKPVIFSSIVARNEKIYHFGITIFYNNLREGGLTICLMDDQKVILTSITFSFGCDKKNKKFLIIGSTQGTNLGKEIIVTTTRNLHGLRPKFALLHCCYSLASYFDIDSIIGVSDKNHILRKQKHNLLTSLDEFWEEAGGIRIENSDYLLPKSLPRRELKDVPQKKRKDWLVRQKYLQQLNDDLTAFLQKHTRSQ